MLDRSKCEMMLVSNDGKTWVKRIVIEIINDGGCTAVTDGFENAFKEYRILDLAFWQFCKPITEKQQIEKWENYILYQIIEKEGDCIGHINTKINEIIDAVNKLTAKEAKKG